MRCANRPSANLGAQPLCLRGSSTDLFLIFVVTLQNVNPESHGPGTQEQSFSAWREPVPASWGLPAPPQAAVSSKVFSKISTAQVKTEPSLLSSTSTLHAVLAPWGNI